MVSIRDVLGLVAENARRTGYPLPVPSDVSYRWARGLGLPSRGDTYLYTGALYQLVPYINSLVAQLEQLSRSRAAGVAVRLARALSKVVDLSRLAPKPDPRDVEYSEAVLRSIVSLLGEAGVRVAYLYEDDLYSGVLLHDMGLDELFADHARRVYRRLVERGAKRLVTVDPHTTYVLSKVYPEYVDGFSVEVVNYLELLAEALEEGRLKPRRRLGERRVIHDPCLYGRVLDIVEQPRRLLEAAGVEVVEPRRSRRMTYCCGGPVEALSPRLARRIAETRVAELRERAERIVTLCPICYANLSRVAGRDSVDDIAVVLARAYA